MNMRGTTDVVVLGGDLPALLLASRLLHMGYTVVLGAGDINAGSFALGPGIFSPHYGTSAHEREQRYGHEVARDLLSYRQMVLDELDQDLSRISQAHGFERGVGFALGHDPHSMLRLRNHHEALLRHGAQRSWGDISDAHIHPSARLVSSHADDRLCEPGRLCRALAQHIREQGGMMDEGVSAENVRDRYRFQVLCQFSSPRHPAWETLVETGPDGIDGPHARWHHGSTPMFDYARRLPDGRWLMGSRRSWSLQRDGSPPDVSDLVRHRHLEPVRSWSRPFALGPSDALPSVERDGDRVTIEGSGQEDPVIDLLATDRVLRLLLGKTDAFGHLWEVLPQVPAQEGFLARLSLQGLLDDRLARGIL